MRVNDRNGALDYDHRYFHRDFQREPRALRECENFDSGFGKLTVQRRVSRQLIVNEDQGSVVSLGL